MSVQAQAGAFPPARPATADASGLDRPPAWLFGFLLLFFVLEYIRPSLAQLKLQMVFIVVAPLVWLLARRRPWSPVLWGPLVLLAICAKDIFIASNNFNAYLTTRAVFGYASVALAISWLMSSFERFRQGIWAWLLVMAYATQIAIRSGGYGPGGMLQDENDMALALCTAFGLAFFVFERGRGLQRLAAGALGAFFVVGIVVTFSRGGFLGLLAVSAYAFLISKRKLMNVGVAVVAVVAFLALAPAKYIDELRTITENKKEDTGEQRLFLWATAWNMFLAHPILGVGGGNFMWEAGNYQPTGGDWPEDFYERSWSGTVTHSLYFQILSEHGLPGVLIFAAIAFLHFRNLGRLVRRVAQDPRAGPGLRNEVTMWAGALRAAVIGYFAAGAFISVAIYPYLWYFSAMGVALEACVERELGPEAGGAAAAVVSSGETPAARPRRRAGIGS